jgi:hypothetical protein
MRSLLAEGLGKIAQAFDTLLNEIGIHSQDEPDDDATEEEQGQEDEEDEEDQEEQEIEEEPEDQ